MPHSHHSHSGEFCRHASDSLEDVILEAIRQSFQVFGLSEHAPRYRIEDLFPEESDLTPFDLKTTYLSFMKTASSLRDKYKSQINLLIGLETDYITSIDLTKLNNLLESHPKQGREIEIDYIVGSVHHVSGISIDFSRETWLRSVKYTLDGKQGRTMNPGPPPSLELEIGIGVENEWEPSFEELIPFYEKYFDQQFHLINQHQPEVIGHFDLCLLYTPHLYPKLKEVPSIWNKVERNVKKVVEYGGLFEANSAALRKGWGSSYPSYDILQLILSLGGRICLSDDSHGTSYVGLNYLKMREYLVQSGVEEIWYLVPNKDRQPELNDKPIGKRGRVSARSMKDWDKHPFWAKLQFAQAQAQATKV